MITKKIEIGLIVLLLLVIVGQGNAQVDTLILKNGNTLIGEVKSMSRGVLQIETDYSDSDFKVTWDEIKYISTVTLFLITIDDGARYNGSLISSGMGKISIIYSDGKVDYTFDDIVSLNSVSEDFWSRLNASIDLGFSSTKANNFTQFTSNSNIGYTAERWSTGLYYNSLLSSQDNIDNTKRIDYGGDYKQFLRKGWYIPADISLLSNNEQLIDLRVVGKLGMGKYIIQKNSAYWGVTLGTSYVAEEFIAATDTTSADPSKSSYEGFIGTELNLFDIGDFSLQTKLVVFPSFTEKGRVRSDFDINAKYDFPMDFYIKLSYSLNYDNQPVANASELDYVSSIGFGWSW